MATSTYMANRQKYQRPQGLLFADNPGTKTIHEIIKAVTGSVSSVVVQENGVDLPAEIILDGKVDIKPGHKINISGNKRGLTDGVEGLEVTQVFYTLGSNKTTVVIDDRPTSDGTIVFSSGPVVYIPDGKEFENFIILTDDNRGYIDLSHDRIEKRERMINGRMRSYHIADKRKVSVSWDQIPSKAFSEIPMIITTPGDSDGDMINSEYTTSAKFERHTTDGGAGGSEMKAWYDNNVGSFWVFLSFDDYKVSGGTDSYDKLVGYGEPIEMFFSSFAHTVQRRGVTYDFWNVQLSLEEV